MNMNNKKVYVLIVVAAASMQARAEEPLPTNGFIQDSSLNILLRNAYISRDYKDGNQDKAEWGQAISARFTSGFTDGFIGFGINSFADYAVRLDGGKGRSGAGGIDFFKQGDSGAPADDIAKAGASIKLRLSKTVVEYGDQMPVLPVLRHDSARLLPDAYTGTLITSRELEGLEVNLGRFTAQSRKSAEGRDSGGLDRIDVYGVRYRFNNRLSAALYASDIQQVLKRHYANLLYEMPLEQERSLTVDFNAYKTRLDKDFAAGAGRDNVIWSLAATYKTGPHAFMLAHQRNTGDTGYIYGRYQNAGGVGDSNGTIYVANSYWSDFNAEDERSWQLSYAYDFGASGVPGLSYRVAYVRGDNIKTQSTGDGRETELFNQLQYVVQSGKAKDLSFKVRSSHLNVSNKASNYNIGGNELRIFVDYPISIF
ncbi:outer membrane porin, OprD family [Pseudomonas gessardii]|nr:outer membrane porin, OprD family [Pseudomonas gessardii]